MCMKLWGKVADADVPACCESGPCHQRKGCPTRLEQECGALLDALEMMGRAACSLASEFICASRPCERAPPKAS